MKRDTNVWHFCIKLKDSIFVNITTHIHAFNDKLANKQKIYQIIVNISFIIFKLYATEALLTKIYML